MTHNDYDDFEGLEALRKELFDMIEPVPVIAQDAMRSVSDMLSDRADSADGADTLKDAAWDISVLVSTYREGVTEARAYRTHEPIAVGDRFKYRGDTYVVTSVEPPSFRFNPAQRPSPYRWNLNAGISMGRVLSSGKPSTATVASFTYRQLQVARTKDSWGSLRPIEKGVKQ